MIISTMGGTRWVGKVTSPQTWGAFSWFLEALRLQCALMERSRLKMLALKQAKKLAKAESARSLAVRLPKSSLSQHPFFPPANQTPPPWSSGINSLSKFNIHAQDLPFTSVVLPLALVCRKLPSMNLFI